MKKVIKNSDPFSFNRIGLNGCYLNDTRMFDIIN